MTRTSPTIFLGVGESWRVGEEGHPLVARRCCCSIPLPDDGDCAKWGRTLSIRLGPAAENGGGPHGSDRDARLNPFVMPSRKFVGFTAPADLVDDLKDLATSRERTVSAELRFLIREHLQEESARPDKSDAFQTRAEEEPVGAKV